MLTELNLKHNMEKVVRTLNWYYYGVMVLSLIALTIMYYLFSKGMYEPIDPLSQLGATLQYVVIFAALITIPLGLYLIKWLKPQTLEKYEQLAICRIIMVSGTLPLGIILFYLLGGYKPMMWVAAIAAVSWYFTKPTIGKIEQEMEPKDPNEETY